MASRGGWPTRKALDDLAAFANLLEEKHLGHPFDMAFFEYRGIHYAVSKCDDCQEILGIAPVPEEQYTLYKVAYETVVKLDKKQRAKKRGHQPAFHTRLKT